MNTWKERGAIDRNPLIPFVAALEKVCTVKLGSLPWSLISGLKKNV